ncbi:unannotated protein [freshwater metagenome]|uniref:Unannotated protein n=1 Tax=freshwater metagenome TaxID=449393 RepID=A0A6J6PNW7_9ZZZZ
MGVKKVNKVYPLVIHNHIFALLQRVTRGFAYCPQSLRLVTTTNYIK